MRRWVLPSIVTTLFFLSLIVTASAAPPKVDVNSVPRADDPATDFNVSATRHNLGRTDGPGFGGGISNDTTDEVCVFCHTPHWSNADPRAADAPLWNRMLSGAVYTVYSSSTMDSTPGQPDGNSVACLSCHDGTVAFDALVNAPGRANSTNGYTFGGGVNATFVNDPTFSLGWGFFEGGVPMASPATFVEIGGRVLIGTDLSNDHPISMVYPTPAQDPAFNQPPGAPGGPRVFPNGIRTFDGDKVQCGSCHDPHVSASAKGIIMYLRMSNQESAMCLTCHIK